MFIIQFFRSYKSDVKEALICSVFRTDANKTKALHCALICPVVQEFMHISPEVVHLWEQKITLELAEMPLQTVFYLPITTEKLSISAIRVCNGHIF